MNDTTLAEAVKSRLTETCDSLSTVHLAIPASEIMARADKAHRRRLGLLAGAGGLAAAAVAVSIALPASHTASGPGARPSGPGAHLAAWTVTRKADGSIQVSFFRQLRDPAALQRTLRADGIPASVTFIGQQNPACRRIPSGGRPPGLRGARPLERSGPGRPSGRSSGGPGLFRGTLNRVVSVGGPLSGIPAQDAMVIHPAALPSGDGLRIAVMRGIPSGPAGPWPYPKGSGHPEMEVGLVNASPQCTGS